ncbi:flagellar assembly protein FliH [Tepidamorphus gemmatus]|uniref:Flagellar assembly protein FliH n=1 Tax=Tepidamorphus gemmatus TaxID=747076 RepID=A0A4R3MLT9_9HYPH|nr:FliH/SctL family protein [Tepidamorphus gemmatus]TCT13410.1 flagellar assembly protein FliH [Tepidamorphus gemmatus]
MQRQTAVKPAPYLFDEIFALDVEPVRPTAPAIDRAMLDAAVERARAEGHAAGLAEGRRAASEAIAAQTARAAETLVAELDRLISSAAAERARIESAAVELALTAAGRLARTLVAAMPHAEVERMLRDSLSDLRDVPHVVVRVSETIADDLRQRIGTIATQSGFEGRIVVLADPEIAEGDGRIDWADGGIVRDSAAISKAIEQAAARYLARSAARDQDENR